MYLVYLRFFNYWRNVFIVIVFVELVLGSKDVRLFNIIILVFDFNSFSLISVCFFCVNNDGSLFI